MMMILQVKLLPQYLADLGYESHMIGKWHLGHHRQEYTPTHRGFNSHFGFWTGKEDYFSHVSAEEVQGEYRSGYDLRRNMSVSWAEKGDYITDVFTKEAERLITKHSEESDAPVFLYLSHLAVHAGNEYSPLQAPRDAVERHAHIEDERRRVFGGMLERLDQSVGRVTSALSRTGMLEVKTECVRHVLIALYPGQCHHLLHR